ncbi:MAG: sugar phosphate isomerase/epimerase [Verrucomicrobiales bacterium]|jgi:sugar phosphate isomerase/epimerase
MIAAMNRRRFLKTSLASSASAGLLQAAEDSEFKFRYIVGSSMYGGLPLAEILPEVPKTGAEFIDIWPKSHGTQREQVDEMGHDAFQQMLAKNAVKLGCSTRYDLGPFGLQAEMKIIAKLGGDLLICGGKGVKGLEGEELKAGVKAFAEQLKPHAEAAGEAGVRIGIENHANNLIHTPDSLKWLAEFAPEQVGVALAPYHLETLDLSADHLAELVLALGDRMLMFYAWQHGHGCMKKLPKEEELLQMPGRGDLDFTPIIAALKKIGYAGYTEIFMHPVPRGIPILPTAAETTAEINRGRAYLEGLDV